MGILTGMGRDSLGGFGRESYLAYALWAIFIGRVTANWMYEFEMMNDIETGRVNSILVRPISFFEHYLSQFMGYKGFIFLSSLFIPIATCWIFDAPVIYERLPLMILGVFHYLIFSFTFSFIVASCAFFMNKTHSLTAIKNMMLWVLTGEMIPLDLFPESMRSTILWLPFSSGVYMPVGYLIGRVNFDTWLRGQVSVLMGTVFLSLVAMWIWHRGVREYTGTGA